ncbi:hypothetical protein Bca4012_019974 [Brassica carinata]
MSSMVPNKMKREQGRQDESTIEKILTSLQSQYEALVHILKRIRKDTLSVRDVESRGRQKEKLGRGFGRKDSHWKHEYLQNWNNNGNKKTPTNLVKELEGGRVS